MADIGKAYKELAKRYRLPDYSKINNEFELCFIEKEEFLLRQIIRIMIERSEFFTTLIDSVLHPDGSQIAPLHECRLFGEKEKEELYDLYKALMKHHRAALVVNVARGEKEEAGFITDFFREWELLRPRIASMAKKIQQSWENDTTIKEVLEYFG
ncbi:TPA: hypothetical protein HA281_06745 [Candidatus Woesearchaeota archaeon]|nr:hypothetical protein [Candidatus Woesearchaeota archaeon]HIH04850.1 hypothetical protein [Candidatus Woesearchaeota archaeon]HIH92467.1 hypothetical protein [Candidatus Woesearchaeota archaeon]HII64217.1 hypothetical protein [Candidatus Woesearchaeota archaeon]HII65247.1 hypothetical protein [Candidatus Woesearchaeota archaeon]